MKLQDILPKKAVIMDLKSGDKSDVLSQLGQYIASIYDLKNPDIIVQGLLDRESQISTGIGYGIAIPHARVDTVDNLYMVVARCRDGIEFDAIDDSPVNLIFTLVYPSNTSAEHTQILSSLSKIMSYESMRESLMNASDAEEFCQLLTDGENKYVS